MQCVVSSHQELSGNTQYAVIAPVCVTLRSSVHFFHMEQKITSTTPQHNREHNHALCPTAPFAHASYKGYGCNIVKPPQPPHRNTMINVVVLGCGSIRTGKGAAAPFIGVHILGEIWPAGGFDTLAESRWEDRIGPSILVQKVNHITINRGRPLCVRRIGRGTERRPCLWRRKLGGIFYAWGGWKAWAIGDRAVHFNGSARSYSINTPQLILVRLGGG
jgi:hypothetical protein